MGKCSLCEKKIKNDKASFGLNCLKEVCLSIGIEDIKNLNGEKLLNKEIQMICNKENLSKEQSNLLTNRYLTLKLLDEIKLDEYNKYRIAVQKDLDTINKTTSPEELKSFNKITLRQAKDANKKYKKYKTTLTKILNGDYDKLQNITFDTFRFAFNMYYLNKPYLSDLNQKLQYGILKFGVFSLKLSTYSFSAKCLDHALQKKPKDMNITDINVIKKIKNDESFKQKINQTINKYKNKTTFITTNDADSIISFDNSDLFYSLHDATIIIKGKKQNHFWNLDVQIYDVYDFTDFKELKEYIQNSFPKSLIASTANNFAMISVSSNVIHEYKITIKFQMRKKSI